MWIWSILQLFLLVTLASSRADEADDLLDTSDAKPKPEYHVHAGQWTQCSDSMPSKDNMNPGDVLVHIPRIGIKRRQVHCRTKYGQNVEPMYCEPTIKHVRSDQLCIMASDCILGDWSEWRPRADGALVRNRHILQLPQADGKACGLIEEVKPVAPDPTAHWSPGPWGPCKVAHEIVPTDIEAGTLSIYDGNDNVIASYDDPDDYSSLEELPTPNCGGGNQRREAKCVSASGRDLHPSQCTYASLPTLVQPCEEACPRDCQVGDWGPWSPCEPTDGCPLFPVQELTSTGFSIRRRRVTSAASNGGAPCPPLEEKRSCVSPRCASWQALPWGSCQLQQPRRLCGRGKRSRELRCVGHDGKEAQAAWCSGSSAPARFERCRIACAGDCVVSAWGAWSACSAECAAPASPPPTRRRERHILATPSSTGWPCPTPDQLVQHEMCNAHACATYSWLTTPWGPCQANRIEDEFPSNITEIIDGDTLKESEEEEPCIEEGEMTRDVMCVQNNTDVVKDSLCAPLHRPVSRRACTIRCHRGCRVEAWGPWSECPNTCEPNKQTRSRKVHGGETCGSPQQSRDCPIPRSCHEEDLQWYTGNWSVCQLLPGDNCGEGYKVRSIRCGAGSYNSVDAGQCAGLQVPKTWTRCIVPCGKPQTITCKEVCENALLYLDNDDPEIPKCFCKNVTLEVLKSASSCILTKRSKCGMGYALHAAICRWKGAEVPMAICRKYHSLTGNHSSPYGYNLEIPDLVESDCSVQCARDCLTGPWGAWGPCAAEAGSLAAFRFRSREVLEEGTAGGRECGATLQRATCIASEPHWNVGEWGSCRAEHRCGDGITSRNVTCVDSSGAEVNKKLCTLEEPVSRSACRVPCPNDCYMSAWSEWSPCEPTTWGGRKDRTRVVLRPGMPGGRPCGRLVEAGPCPAHAYSWHVAPWEDCQPLGGSPCGEGIKQRSVRCLRSDGVFVDDSFCPNATASEPRESWCYVPCGVDCELSEWSAWDRSACRCWDTNDNYMRRIRQQLTASVWPGRACEELEQKAPCPREPCMRLVSREAAKCILQPTALAPNAPEACGWGSKSVMNRCELTEHDGEEMAFDAGRCHNTLPGHIVYPPIYYEESECEIPCGCVGHEARAGPWGPWGPCRGGARVRSRRLRPAPRPPCNDSHRHLSIEWMNCTENDVTSHPVDVSKKRIEKLPQGWTNPDNLYSNGYLDGSTSVLGIVWIATLVLCIYGSVTLFIGIKRCLRSRQMKSITKV